MNVTLVADTTNYTDIYKEILHKQSLKVVDTIYLDAQFKSDAIETDIAIIDISKKQTLDKLEKLFLIKNCFVFLISPFSSYHLNIPNTFENTIYYILEKPLNVDKLKNMLESSKNDIKQVHYLQSKEGLLIDLVDQSPVRIALYDKNGKLSYANQKYIDANNIKQITATHYFDEIIQCNIEFQSILYYLKTTEIFTSQKMHQDRWYKSIFYYTNRNKSIVHMCNDITNEKVELDHLRKTAQFFEETNEAVTITDQNGIILAVNKAFCNITGYTMDEAVGKPTSILSSKKHDSNFYENLWDNLKYYGRWQGEIWNRRKNGEIYPEWLSISKTIDSLTNEINYMAIFTDISSLKEADKKLHFYANYDHLTGLINRVQFENMLTHTIQSSARNHKKFALLFIDLDNFKDVNDSFGHDVGDLVLKEVGSRIRNDLRKEDIVARIGGDEFNVVLTNVESESSVLDVANNLNETIKKPIVIEKRNFYLSLSIGVAMYPKHGNDYVTLAKSADQAMYEVKKNDRDGVLLYNSNYSADLLHKITLKNELKTTIENCELEVYYQPVINLHTKKVSGAEALVRWNHPKKGFIPPDQFIQIAENHGMILDLGEFVVKKVYEDLPIILKKFGANFKVAINMSSKEFAHKTYVDKLIEMTHDFHLDFNNIELEITETYIMQNHNEAIKKLQKLKDAGFSLAIDDFGTGYSSLSYLKSFPIDKLKIDKAFVLNILEDDSDQALVKIIVQIANIFKLKVQAEGVESLKHLQMLQEYGCDIAQGFYYSKPIPLHNLLEFKGIQNV